ncbi:MAG: hypothetical protein IPK97_04940 [Ahniella sp.]|nr:hypothetical protein [Ahniella sp.]
MKAVDPAWAVRSPGAPPSIRIWLRPWQAGLDSLKELATVMRAGDTDRIVTLSRSASGRPILHEPSGHVSISHTGTLLALAHADSAVGVDCEMRRRERPWLEWAERYFAPYEQGAVAEAEDP